MMAFRWRAEDGQLIVVFGTPYPQQLKQKTEKNFRNPRMKSKLFALLSKVYSFKW